MEFPSAATWGLVYVTSEWVIRVIMLIVVPFRRSPDAAKGWLLLVFFFPWVGIIIYFFIGSPKYPRWRTERFQKMSDVFGGIAANLQPKLEPFRPNLPQVLLPAAKLVQNLGYLGLLGENEAELLADYDGSIDRLVTDIDESKHHVHLLFYIFASDSTGQKVIDALTRAVKRGVACRVLVDFLGARAWATELEAKLTAGGIEMHRVLPVGFFRQNAARADLRNHRKIAVIDGVIAYTGSQNIVDSDFKKGIVYEEMVVRVCGPIALQFQAVFASDWYMETEEVLNSPEIFPAPAGKGGVSAQLLPSGPDYPTTNAEHLMVALLYVAQKRIVITTPYFIPDESMLLALDTAVRRGVDVHLVMSRKADQLLVSLAQKSYYSELLEAGVHVHLYRDKFLHAKHLSLDDAVSVIGSCNMDIRSFVLNSEAVLVSYDRALNSKLHQHQERYFAGSDLLITEEWESRSLFFKVCENLARLMSPLL